MSSIRSTCRICDVFWVLADMLQVNNKNDEYEHTECGAIVFRADSRGIWLVQWLSKTVDFVLAAPGKVDVGRFRVK
ncbi:uncharacterized protein N7479_000787 [Penicillium vulpinum]|uniref:uncharacterized protein n=1 Tax=Penicillium vulpinum TaxID=29845 RepID=UPI00254849A1|nr:uncharacterized protein N7479_000787 [Penicillium vulpinum]KAJ5970869.1 hypothetical protein N7479_000787 [Penicillium vulpinum]